MAVVIDRAKIDALVHHLVLQVLMAKNPEKVSDAQRVAGNKIADMIWDEASVKFESISKSIEEEIEGNRIKGQKTESSLTRAKLTGKIEGLELANMIVHNTD